MIAVVATFGGVLFGYDTGVINGALGSMKPDLGLTDWTTSFVTSILIFGAAIGGVCEGSVSTRFSRKRGIQSLALIFMVGTLGCVLSPELGGAGGLPVHPGAGGRWGVRGGAVFLAEIVPSETRGRMVTRNEFGIVFGQFLAFVINAVIHNYWVRHQRDLARDAAGRGAVRVRPVLRDAAGSRVAALAGGQGAGEEDHEVLKLIRSPKRTDAELEEVRLLVEEDREAVRMGWSVILHTGWIRRAVLIGAFSQFSGINVIMYYGTELLKTSGFSADSAILADTLNGVASMIGVTLAAMITNCFRRRTMIILDFCLMTFFHVLVGLSAQLVPDEFGGKPYLILVLVALFVFSMQAFTGPLSWLLLSEVFPLRTRSFAMGSSVFMLWLANGLVTLGFLPVVTAVGVGPTFGIFALLSAIAIWFMVRYVPESSGKALEAVEAESRAHGV